jgi:Short C-terminal domain/Phospholipase_D-nuclease N-terminal
MNSFADFFWYMIEFYIVFMVIWIFIRVFADIFRRTDMTGGMKALWIIAIFVIPFFGALVYIITRPRIEGDAFGGPQAAVGAPAAAAPVASTSAADEITKLTALHDAGTLTDAEFEAAKAKALA